MRVLMLAQFYPPIVGGAELHVQSLSVELARRGHDVAVATLAQEGLPDVEDDDGVRIYRLHGAAQAIRFLHADPKKRSAMPLPDPAVAYSIARLLNVHRPDIVHAHNWMLHSYLPLDSRQSTPFVVTLHDFSLVCAKQTLVQSRAGGQAICSGPAVEKCLRCAGRHYGAVKGIITTIGNWGMTIVERRAVDLFIPVSADVAAGNRLAAQRVRFRVIPNFVPDDVNTVRSDTEFYVDALPAGDFLLFVGGLARSKGVKPLLRAYEQLGPSAPPLVLIGYPTPETPELVAALPPNVKLFESWPHAAVMQAWGRCLFGIVPSIWREPCPTSVIEAMTAGAAVIASRIGGIPELITDERSGLLATAGDADALASKMRRLLVDEELRGRLRREARSAAVEFHASRVVPRIESAYEDVRSARLDSRA